MSKLRRLRLLADGVERGELLEASGFAGRFLGLMGRAAPPLELGLLFRPCSSIHTLFMRYPIDVVYLGPDGHVLKVANVRPWRLSIGRGARAVIEMESGMASRVDLRPGAVVELTE